MARIIITPAHPAFGACQDCDWPTARAIARELGDEHVAAVEEAEAAAAEEARLEAERDERR